MINKTFKTAPYVELRKNEYGKERVIHKLPYFPDRIVHHAIVQAVGHIWNQTLIRDTYACIKGRGIHDGANRVKSALRDVSGTKYCLKMDVSKFYQSMDHAILKSIIRRKIKDPDVLWLIDEIIDSVDAGVGIPIGNYLSQFFGNLYLSGYDHFMKEVNGCRYYFRYCDDVVILDGYKARLHKLREFTAMSWRNELKLTLKSNWQVFPVGSRGIDFLGYRFFHHYTLLRKSITKKFKRRMLKIKRGWKYMKPPSIASSISSYNGWLVHADCHNLSKQHIDSEILSIRDNALNEMKLKGKAA